MCYTSSNMSVCVIRFWSKEKKKVKRKKEKKYYKWFSQTNHVRYNSIFIARFDSFVLSFDQKKLPKQQQIPSVQKCDETGESTEKNLKEMKKQIEYKMDSWSLVYTHKMPFMMNISQTCTQHGEGTGHTNTHTLDNCLTILMK